MSRWHREGEKSTDGRGTPIRLGGTRDTVNWDGEYGVLDGGAAGEGPRLSDAWGEEYRGGPGGHACAWETA